jgi:hypothetical protein
MNIVSKNLDELKAARADKNALDLRLLSFHKKVYQLLLSSYRADEIRKQARKRIELWRSNKLCSLDYINAWDQMIDDLNEFKMKALDEVSDQGVALRQNTPFSDLMRELS